MQELAQQHLQVRGGMRIRSRARISTQKDTRSRQVQSKFVQVIPLCTILLLVRH